MHGSIHGRGDRLCAGAAFVGELPGVYGARAGACDPVPATGFSAGMDPHPAAAGCVDGSAEAGDGGADLRDGHLDRVAVYFVDQCQRPGRIAAGLFTAGRRGLDPWAMAGEATADGGCGTGDLGGCGSAALSGDIEGACGCEG